MADRTVVLSQNGRHAVRGLSVNNPSEFSAYQDDDDDLTYVVDLSAYLDGDTITVVTRVPQGVFISNSSNTTTRLTQRLRGFGYVDFKVQTSAGDVEEFRINILRRTGSKVVLGASGGGGTAITDGDFGDIVVSGGGSVWSIDAGVIVDADINASAAIAPTKLAFTQAGTGAVARTVDSKLKDVVSVFDFMTTAQINDVRAGSLSVDVTAAIQAALDAVSILYFPAGTYRCTNTITLTGSNKTLLGEPGKTILQFTPSAATNCFVIGPANPQNTSTSPNTSTRVSGITFFNTLTNPTGSTVVVRKSTSVLFQNCYFWGGFHALLVEGGRNVELQQCFADPVNFVNAAGSSAIRITDLTETNPSTVSYKGFTFRIHGGLYNGSTYDSLVSIKDHDYVLISSAYMAQTKKHILLKPTVSGDIITNVEIADTYLDGGAWPISLPTIGVDIDGTSAATAKVGWVRLDGGIIGQVERAVSITGSNEILGTVTLNNVDIHNSIKDPIYCDLPASGKVNIQINGGSCVRHGRNRGANPAAWAVNAADGTTLNINNWTVIGESTSDSRGITATNFDTLVVTGSTFTTIDTANTLSLTSVKHDVRAGNIGLPDATHGYYSNVTDTTGSATNYNYYAAGATDVTNNWNFYAAGTSAAKGAKNYFGGDIYIGEIANQIVGYGTPRGAAITATGRAFFAGDGEHVYNRNSDGPVISFYQGATACGAIRQIQASGTLSVNGVSNLSLMTNSVDRVAIDVNGNVGIGTATFGTNAVRVLGLFNGTEPSTGPADTVQIYSVDRSAGNTIPAIWCEGSGVTNAGITSTAVTHKIALKVNGTVYYLLATTNAT